MHQPWIKVCAALLPLALLVVWLSSCQQPAPTAISIVYSSEEKAWLEPLISEYNQSQSRILVQGYATGSLQSIAAIREESDYSHP